MLDEELKTYEVPKFRYVFLKNGNVRETIDADSDAKAFVNFIRVLNKIINHIGYRKYSYILFGNEYIETKSKEKSFVLPCFLNCDYDDRAFRKGYRCINEPLKVSKWDSLEFTKEQIDDIFSKQIREMTKSQKQKNKATRKKKKEQEEFGEEL